MSISPDSVFHNLHGLNSKPYPYFEEVSHRHWCRDLVTLMVFSLNALIFLYMLGTLLRKADNHLQDQPIQQSYAGQQLLVRQEMSGSNLI